MSDDATAVTDDATTEDAPEAAEAAAEETTATETVVEETDATAAAETDDASDAAADTAEPVAEAESVAAAVPGVRVARVFVCERGHRTTTLWQQPTVCQARPVRTAPECGMPLYHITELPEQVQKALNPLKASKKASKKK